MTTKILTLFVLLWVSLGFCGGCASSSQANTVAEWEQITRQMLRDEVEEKTGARDVWHYSGSTEIHHYFYRAPGRMLAGKYSYFKIAKNEYQELPRSLEVPFDGKPVSHSFAFTQKQGQSGYTHSLSLGLVENILKP